MGGASRPLYFSAATLAGRRAAGRDRLDESALSPDGSNRATDVDVVLPRHAQRERARRLCNRLRSLRAYCTLEPNRKSSRRIDLLTHRPRITMPLSTNLLTTIHHPLSAIQ
jgi:hypothetical protein